ncbi:MAG: protein kinase [Candidatus Helarchaeota archaeon]|nr:protein kinase [Candidatus Helarchaeota archaeon]
MIGKTVSHYRITEELGRGGMGVVYKAHDTKLDRYVALKFLPINLTTNPEAKKRFIHEAQAASSLQHDNVCTIHDIDDTDDGQIFICMDCYEGETLQTKIDRGPLEIEDVLSITIQIAMGLEKAHINGIVHRDIKPANIFITKDNVVKILDFGIAKLSDQTMMTRMGETVGTIAYMSPEQARGEKVDKRTDIWSLGVLMYQTITDQLPFKSEYEQALVYAILNEEPTSMNTLRPEIPQELEQVVKRMLFKNPDLRYQQMEDIIDELKSLKSGNSPKDLFLLHKPQSIAVLPFANLSSDTEQEYFCDGLMEETINVLSNVEGLRVVARTSALAFKGKQEDIRDIGKKLNVENVLEGSVRKSGNRLRITTQLIKVSDGYHLWAEKFDRNLEDIFAIQDEIALAIVENLKVKLLKGERAKLVKRRTNNPEAYTLYMKGRFFFNQRKESGIKKSIECYSKAIEIDPEFALAYTGLAESYVFLGDWRVLPLDTAYNEARKAAMTALQIDDTLSEVHLSLAEIKLFCDWDWTAAEQEFKRALTINPACAEAHHMYAHYLELNSRFDEALLEMNRAIELEPLSPSLHSCNVQVLFYARRNEEAIRQCYAAMEMAPSFFGLYGWLGIAFVMSGMDKQGVEALKKGLEHIPMDPRLNALLCYTYAKTNKRIWAKECLDKLLSLSENRFVDPYFVTWPYAALGDMAGACYWLNKAYDEHSEWLPWLGIDPLLDNLRKETMFNDLFKKMRLGK